MTRKWAMSRFLLAGLLVTFLIPSAWTDEPAPPPNTGTLSLTINLNFPTAYFFRGIAQSNAGFHLQTICGAQGELL